MRPLGLTTSYEKSPLPPFSKGGEERVFKCPFEKGGFRGILKELFKVKVHGGLGVPPVLAQLE
jgi:hypothetical protein